MKTIIITTLLFLTFIFSTKAQSTNPDYVELIVKEFREDPIKFKATNLDFYIQQLNNRDIDRLIPMLYEGLSGIIEESDADQNVMGSLNKKFNKRHNRKFNKRIIKKNRSNLKLVLIEGDSWFNFPIPLKDDLTKILVRNKNLAVYTSAFGGDWISRIIKDQSYYKAILQLRPDAFIISGGGNDIVGERLSIFIDLPGQNNEIIQKFKINEKKIIINNTKNLRDTRLLNSENFYVEPGQKSSAIFNPNDDYSGYFSYGKKIEEEVVYGTQYLNEYFFKAIVELELQYKVILQQYKNELASQRESDDVNKMKIISHGYDYPIPRMKKARWFCHPPRALVNTFVGSGKWLYMPMKLKGIDTLETQRKIVKAMIFYFNEMLIDIASKKDENDKYLYPNFYHIDNRGMIEKMSGVEPTRYWYDELHPKGKAFRRISKEFVNLINNDSPKEKVVVAVSNLELTKREIKRAEKKCLCFKTTKRFDKDFEKQKSK